MTWPTTTIAATTMMHISQTRITCCYTWAQTHPEGQAHGTDSSGWSGKIERIHSQLGADTSGRSGTWRRLIRKVRQKRNWSTRDAYTRSLIFSPPSMCEASPIMGGQASANLKNNPIHRRFIVHRNRSGNGLPLGVHQSSIISSSAKA